MILSVDLEDYYMVTALSEVVKRDEWDRCESRVERNTHKLLQILENAETDHNKIGPPFSVWAGLPSVIPVL